MKVKGFQVAPAELEGCLLDHAAVSDACVVGVPDDYSARLLASAHPPILTRVSIAARRRRDPPRIRRPHRRGARALCARRRTAGRAQSIPHRGAFSPSRQAGSPYSRKPLGTQHVAAHKVGYKHLAGGVQFIDAIPTSPSGKLLRRVLRERARGLVRRPAAAAKL